MRWKLLMIVVIFLIDVSFEYNKFNANIKSIALSFYEQITRYDVMTLISGLK